MDSIEALIALFIIITGTIISGLSVSFAVGVIVGMAISVLAHVLTDSDG